MFRFGWLLIAVIALIGCSESATKTVDAEKKTTPPPPKTTENVDVALPADTRAGTPFALGEMAPEIDGVDLDGVEFKLSDYRGKVVMLDFWGDW